MKQFFYEKRIVVVSVLFAIMFFTVLQLVGGIDTNYSIVVEYDNIIDGRAAQLFYNTGDGFNSSQCLTSIAYDNSAMFVVKIKMQDLTELRIDPINKCEDIQINRVYFRWFGLEFNEITGEELYSHIETFENSSLTTTDNSVIIAPTSEDPYFVICDNYIQTVKDFFFKIRICMLIANLIIALVATLVINVLYRFRDSKYVIFKNLADILASVAVIFYVLACLLHKYHNVKFATLTGVLLGYVSIYVWFLINNIKTKTKLEDIVNKMNLRIRNGLILGVYALSVLLMWLALFNGLSCLYLLLYFMPVIISAILCKKVEFGSNNSANNKSAFPYILFVSLFTWISGQVAGEYGSTITMLFKSQYGGQIIMNIMIAIASFGIIFELVAYASRENDTAMKKRAGLVNKSIIIFMVLLFIYEMMNYILGYSYSLPVIRDNLVNYCASPTNLLNIFLFVILYLTIASLINRGTANIVFGALYVFLLIGNIVKLVYHDTYFTIADIFQLADFFRIAKGYVTIERVALVIFGLIVIAIIIYLERKRIKDSLRIKVRLFTFIPLILLTKVSFSDVKSAAFSDLNIIKELNWLSEKEDANIRGIVVYNYFNALKYKEIFPQAPSGYTEDMIAEYIDLFENINDDESTDDGITPNVIMVMMESQFELDNFTDIQIDEVLDPVTKENKVTTLISPRYGGGTASVEFEALTGLSVSFFPGDLIPYTTFFNSTSRALPSVAREFSDNGYQTVAVHPNTSSFYNRDKVYECMGFDEFLADESFDFSTANCTADGFMKNSELATTIINRVEQANESGEPIFLFSVSIEGHREYTSKYTSLDVNIEDDVLTDSELAELNQYAQTVIEDDKFIEELINYVDSADEPTIIYFFGDHLPKLTAFETYGFTLDAYNKYSTPVVAYSNYKDIEIDCEYISPNQLAPQLLKDAGIEYSSYFDYIYSLREDYPVITKAFINDTSGLEIYEIIQYDIMYGKKWFYEEKN